MCLRQNDRPGPDSSHEAALRQRGFLRIAGVDEVGRGPLAGPVTAAAVVLDLAAVPDGIDDSKRLTARRREVLAAEIAACATVSVAHADVAEIDTLNILRASHLAMIRALAALDPAPDFVLIDGRMLPDGLALPARAVVGGDGCCLSIAAASILAKVTRDRIMRSDDEQFPAYDFAWNKGHPCPRHQQALRGLGPCAIHRRSWSWMDDIPWTGARRYVRPDPQASLFD